MSYREDQHLRAVAIEAGRGDLAEAMDRADAALSEIGEQAREAYQRYQELSRTQDHKVRDCKDVRELLRVLAATISGLEKNN